MKLSERMKQERPDAPESEAPAHFGSAPGRPSGHNDSRSTTTADPVSALKRRAQEALLLRMGPDLWDPATSEAALDAQVVR